MKQKTLTRSEKQELTHFFLKGGSAQSLPAKFQGVHENALRDCMKHAEAQKRASHVSASAR